MYSAGLETETGRIVEIPAANVKHISGIPFFDNNGVNLVMSAIVAFTVPKLAFVVWGYYV